jgi:hypothetical protein
MRGKSDSYAAIQIPGQPSVSHHEEQKLKKNGKWAKQNSTYVEQQPLYSEKNDAKAIMNEFLTN